MVTIGNRGARSVPTQKRKDVERHGGRSRSWNCINKMKRGKKRLRKRRRLSESKREKERVKPGERKRKREERRGEKPSALPGERGRGGK